MRTTARHHAAMVTAMAISETREVVIEATPKEILDVIADLESLPEWSGAHQSSEILETGPTAVPLKRR
jgi:hypothetical protein